MVNEFESRLEKYDSPQSKKSESYSTAYSKFIAENKVFLSTKYEKATNFAGKIFKIKPSDKDEQNLKKYISLSHIRVDPGSVMSLAILIGIPFILLALVAFFLNSYFFTVVLFGAGLALIMYFANMPKYIFESWRAKASDQLLLAVLYIVIYMKKDSNLERAILFVANQLPPPLSLDFMKILWDVENGKYSTIKQSLDVYMDTWKDSEPAFVNSMNLIESSLSEPNSSKAKKILEKATTVITQGVQDNMTHFAHNLKSPMQTVHMLGIVLPLLMLIMIPMASAFLAETIQAIHLILIYNVILPISVFFLGKKILMSRPGGATISNDNQIRELAKTKTGFLKLGSISLFLLLSIPTFGVLLSLALGESWSFQRFENPVFYLSLVFIFATGIASYIYFNYKNKKLIELRKTLSSIEDEFSSAIYQLGSRIGENIPTEAAFAKLAESTKGTKVNELFSLINANITQRGMTLDDAIFDPKYGAIQKYPSPLIKSVMKLLLESSKKSPAVAADSMTTLSLYLQKMHQLKERMYDLLSDTLSSMKMQVSFLAPLMAALVVSLSVLITKVLVNLTGQLETLDMSDTAISGAGMAGGLTNIFKVDVAIPPFLLQLIIGIYIIQVIFVLSYLISGILHGSSKVDQEWTFSKNVLSGTLLYCGLALVATFFFSQLAFIVTGVIS